ncbi:MAG: Uma2 family endonuclease [Thermoguttaceae bacterium]|jgi:Uma2 family endonuclease
MTTMVLDRNLEQRVLEERRAWGADKFDEVWEGIYMMTPLANFEHQSLAGKFCAILNELLGWQGLAEVLPGVNLAATTGEWTEDFRCPDVAVFLRDTQAKNCDTHWRGAADFLIEITSPGDRTHEKIAFYNQIGVHEVLIVNRETWTLELYQRKDNQLQKTAESRLPESATLVSLKVPLAFRLQPGEKRPLIEVNHSAGNQQWLL